MPPEDAKAMVAEQVGRLAERARVIGVALLYVKPHGALYHAANRSSELARAVVEGSLASLPLGFTLIGPPDGELRRAAGAARQRRVAYAREGFADRATNADGTLVPSAMLIGHAARTALDALNEAD